MSNFLWMTGGILIVTMCCLGAALISSDKAPLWLRLAGGLWIASAIFMAQVMVFSAFIR